MNCENASSWKQHRTGAWVARDSDGYILRVSPRAGAWHWSVSPPGAGYSVYSGQAPDLAAAQIEAESSLRGLYQEIREAMARPSGRLSGPTSE